MVAKYHQGHQHFASENLSCEKDKIKKVFLILGSVAFIALAFVYLFQINFISEQGILISGLEKEIEGIKRENEKLTLQAISMRSMASVQERMINAKMVPVEKVSYLDAGGQYVAVK